jgi:thiamine pyrophosphokinase
VEKQLSIIFIGGKGPDSNTLKKHLDMITEKPLFVAADSGLILAENAGIKVDYIVGDMDSLPASRLESYPPECVIRHEHDKDYTDTELALQIVIKKGCEKIWIIGGGGGRIDHLFALRSLFERDIFPCRWITEKADIRCIDASVVNTLSCNLKKNAPVSVFPLGGGPWKAISDGLKWSLAGLTWDRGFFGLSNIAENGDFSIIAEKGRFMVIMEILWQQ